MRGIILAGGLGTRLNPLTYCTNKHLIPVGKLPMIEYPLNTLKRIGVESISVVTGGEHFQEIAGYLSRAHPEIPFSFHYQKDPGGIAQALQVPSPFFGDDKFAVILGDNIFEDDFSGCARDFENSEYGAMIFLSEVDSPERFGVVDVQDGRIRDIVEKPSDPPSNLAVTGLYFYDSSVFRKILTLKPSARGELEITDVNRMYLEEGSLRYVVVEGFWHDAGTHDSRRVCEAFVSGGLEESIFKQL